MSQNVLVVEDNSITRKMMRVALESAGYGVFEAPDGKTAVRLAKKETLALILQDILLPDIDGLDLVKELRSSMQDSQVPILACTGLMSKLDEARTIQGGFNDYLFKPVEPSRLIEIIDRYLADRPQQIKSPKEKIKVLLVDDDPIELKLEKIILESQGFAVTTANDGKEAWQTAQESKPDAVLCDLIMPNMNGFDLCMAFRKDSKFASLPIVITSATSPNIEQEDRKLAEKVGADAFVGRTPDLKEAVKAVRAALKRRAHPKPAADSEALTENYIQRLVGRLEQQSYHNGDLIRRAAEEKAQLAVVTSITETLNRKLPLQAALDEALARILDAAGISVGAVYLTEPDGRLVLQSQIGYKESNLDDLQDFFGHSDLLYRALKERQSFKMPSPEITGNVTRDLQKKINAQSLLIAPLVAADEPQGIIVAFSSRSELGDEWVASVKTVTVQLAQAVLLARTLARVSESEQRFRELAENIREIFYVAGSDGRPIHYISPAYEQITGRKCAALYRDPLARLEHMHPDDRQRVEQVFQSDPQHLDQEYRIVKPNGDVRWLHDRTFPVKDETGRVVRTVGIAEDITERKQAEQKAQQNLDRIRALHEIDSAIASTLDLKGVLNVLLEKLDLFLPHDAATVRLYNERTQQLDLVAGRNIDEEEWNRHMSHGTQALGPTWTVFQTRKPLAVRRVGDDPQMPRGRFFVRQGLVSFLGVPLVAKEAALGVLTLYAQDERDFTAEEVEFLSTIGGQAAIAIHNAQLHEQTKKQAEALEVSNRVKDEFLSVMSHELRTPLSVIMGYTGLVKDGMLGAINPQQADALKKVLGRATEQLGMVNDIMQTIQLESRSVIVERYPVSVGGLMEQLRAVYQNQSSKPAVKLVWNYPEGPVEMATDGAKLKQILQNIINNALKFTDAGAITVSARMDQGENRKATGVSDQFIEFTVSDSGVGIPEDKLPTIFDKFFQVDSSETRLYGGVGLGLYIVKKFTAALGGTVRVESKPGKGSMFTVKIPVEN